MNRNTPPRRLFNVPAKSPKRPAREPWKDDLINKVASEFRIVPGVGKGDDRKITLQPMDDINLLLILPLGCNDQQLYEKALVVVEEFQPGQYRVSKAPQYLKPTLQEKVKGRKV